MSSDHLEEYYLLGRIDEAEFRKEAGHSNSDDATWIAYKARVFEVRSKNYLFLIRRVKGVLQPIIAWSIIILVIIGINWFFEHDKKELPEGYFSGYVDAWREAYTRAYKNGYESGYDLAFENGYQEAFDPLKTLCQVLKREDGSYSLSCPEHPTPRIGSMPVPYFDVPDPPIYGPASAD